MEENKGCQYIFKQSVKKGQVCGIGCRGDFCKQHKPARLERKRIANRAPVEYERKKAYRIANKDHVNELDRELRAKKHREDVDFVIRRKIGHQKEKDTQRGRPFADDEFVTFEWVKEKLEECQYKCPMCDKQMSLCGFEAHSHDQFTIDRLDNTIAHIMINCQILCYGCNHAKH